MVLSYWKMNGFPVKLLGNTFCFAYLPSAWSHGPCWGKKNKQTRCICEISVLLHMLESKVWPPVEAWNSSCSVPAGTQQSWDILRGTTQTMPTAGHTGYQLWYDHLDLMSLSVSSFFPVVIAKQSFNGMFWKLSFENLCFFILCFCQTTKGVGAKYTKFPNYAVKLYWVLHVLTCQTKFAILEYVKYVNSRIELNFFRKLDLNLSNLLNLTVYTDRHFSLRIS